MIEQGPLLVALVVGLFIVVFPTFWCLIVLLLSYVGGWQRLSKVHASTISPHGRAFHWISGGIGIVSYRNCLTVHVAPEGLFLSMPFIFRIGHKTLLIPWQAIHSQEAARFLWAQAVRFQVGQPSQGQIQLPSHVLEAQGA